VLSPPRHLRRPLHASKPFCRSRQGFGSPSRSRPSEGARFGCVRAAASRRVRGREVLKTRSTRGPGGASPRVAPARRRGALFSTAGGAKSSSLPPHKRQVTESEGTEQKRASARCGRARSQSWHLGFGRYPGGMVTGHATSSDIACPASFLLARPGARRAPHGIVPSNRLRNPGRAPSTATSSHSGP
jgi:hypothetical protein